MVLTKTFRFKLYFVNRADILRVSSKSGKRKGCEEMKRWEWVYRYKRWEVGKREGVCGNDEEGGGRGG